MVHNEKIVSHLTINGFTINPIKDIHCFTTLINSLCTIYDKEHECDHKIGVMHENYLGKQVGEPSISYIENESFKGLIGFTVLENGYFVIKIWDNIYPAEIQFDLYLDEKIKDCDLIIDHLSCPAQPYDGMGLFNITYSLNNCIKSKTFISKNNNQIPPYYVNQPFNIEELNEKKENYYVTLNQLKEIECHFCNEQATNLIFVGIPKKIAAVCKMHLNIGSPREGGGDNNNDNSPLDKRYMQNRNLTWTKKQYRI
jgi:hypothetical protein